jgi:cell division protein FtsW (lipid II flippase)
LSIHSKAPGFNVTMLVLPAGVAPKKNLYTFFFGSKNATTEIPISSYSILENGISISQYTEDGSGLTKEFSLDQFPNLAAPSQIPNKYIREQTFLLGTDKYGRDLLSRMLIGIRISLAIGFVAVFISLLIGVSLGAIAGYFGGKADAIIMWIINVTWSIPTLLLVIAITLALGKGFWQVFIAMGIFLKNKKQKQKPSGFKYATIAIACISFAFSVSYIFNNVFEQRHRDRFNIVLGKEIDTKGIGYNTNQSEIAIGSGGWFGKGWTQGTQTKGNFVPEQHTDYIFSTVGEEWGFIGSLGVVILFIFLIIRVLVLAEQQKSQFARIYGYSVGAILFFHFFINVGMVTGLFPTVGIPLPFFSYGGSGLWGFTILLFIFVRLDASNYYYT